LRGIAAAALLAGLAVSAQADVPQAVARIGAGYDGFAAATAALAEQARTSCDSAALRPAFHAAWDAWLAVSHIRIGPVEDQGRALAIAFWPDPKGLGLRAQQALLTGDPAALDPERFAEQSVAARGLSGLERLLFPARAPAADPCPLIRATTADLARMAAGIQAEWPAFAQALLTAGATGNSRYLSPGEARQALLTQLVTGLGFTADQRLGRPLGSFERPQPDRGEARASGRTLHNIVLSVQAARGLTADLVPEAPRSLAALDRALARAEGLDDPVLDGVATPQGRLKVEVLQQSVLAARDAVLAELPPALGVGMGFNALDGD
jgi:predicted lipoprotein